MAPPFCFPISSKCTQKKSTFSSTITASAITTTSTRHPHKLPANINSHLRPLAPADVVPAVSGVQEYDIADLPSNSIGQPITDRDTRLTTVVDGRRYDLAFITNGQPIRARQTVIGTISVTGADGKPFTQLEPVMGAFAHIVGFSEDGKSVLHIHPSSKIPSGPQDRAGPVFAFKFYAPAPGFLRLYCQVQINGADVFAPFNLKIAP
jgi:hypothetical protein